MRKLAALVVTLAFLLPGLAWAEMMSVKVNKCNFRQGPSVKKSIAFKADKYYPVKVLKKQKGWLQVVDFEGDKAWVLAKLLDKQKAVVVAKPKANVRDKANTKSKILFTAAQGAAFKVLKSQGKWLLVQHADGDRGWIHKSLVWGN